MIDTVRLHSPYVTEDLAEKLEKISTVFESYDAITDAVNYKFTKTELKGSFDSAIHLQVKRMDSIYNPAIGRAELQDSPPYVLIEFSLQKFIMGQNIVKPVEVFQESLKYALRNIEGALEYIYSQNYGFVEIDLPDINLWIVERFDISMNFDVGSKDNVDRYFKSISKISFPRRKKSVYANGETYYFGSTTYTIKIYQKGKEYLKNDYKKILKLGDPLWADYLKHISERIIRFEIEFKKRKIQTELNKEKQKIRVSDIIIDDWYKKFEEIILKLLGEGENMQIVRTTEAVRMVLFNNYKRRLANTLFATYCNLVLYEKNDLFEFMDKTTLNRHIRKLKEVGVSWHGSDLVIDDSNLNNILDFSLKSIKRITFDQNDILRLVS